MHVFPDAVVNAFDEGEGGLHVSGGRGEEHHVEDFIAEAVLELVVDGTEPLPSIDVDLVDKVRDILTDGVTSLRHGAELLDSVLDLVVITKVIAHELEECGVVVGACMRGGGGKG